MGAIIKRHLISFRETIDRDVFTAETLIEIYDKYYRPEYEKMTESLAEDEAELFIEKIFVWYILRDFNIKSPDVTCIKEYLNFLESQTPKNPYIQDLGNGVTATKILDCKTVFDVELLRRRAIGCVAPFSRFYETHGRKCH